MSGDKKLCVGYWHIRGLGAPCRMACEFVEADYNNRTFEVKGSDEKEWDLSAWFSVKPGFQKRNALMNLPYVVDTDGFTVTQTVACLSYLGRKFGISGGNNQETSKVEQILCEAQDLRNKGVMAFYGNQKQNLVNYLNVTVPNSYAKFEGWLVAQETGPYTVGNAPTVGDFHLWEMLDQGELLAGDLGEASPLAKYPRLQKLYDTMRAEPTLQGYFAGPLYHLPVNNTMALWGNKSRSIGELYYFPVRGRGEPLRFLMRYAKIPYTDNIVMFKDWPELKKTVPNGQLPAIKLPNGRFIGETGDIARYIATRAGAPLMPEGKENQDSAARIFRISNTEPLTDCTVLTTLLSAEEAEPKIPKCIADVLKVLESLEPELLISEHSFFGGKTPHYGEFGLFHVVNLFLTLSKPSPKLPNTWKEWYNNMCSLPGLKEYLDERPKAMAGKEGKSGSRIDTIDLDS